MTLSYYSRMVATVNASLVGLYPLEETSGTDAVDYAGGGYDATYSGPTLNNDTSPDTTPAPTFDGANDNVDLAASGLLAALDMDEITWMGWLKVDSAGVWTDSTAREFIILYADPNNLFRLYRSGTDNTIIFEYVAGGTTKSITVGSLSYTDWFHVVLTVSATADEMIAYINGAQVGTTQTSLGTWAGTPGSGTVGSGGSTFWHGSMALIGFWTTPLSAVNIFDIYTGILTTPDAAIRVYIDWDQDGFGAPGSADDVTADVRDGQATLGILGQEERIAEVGQLTLTLDNTNRAYTPDYAGGPNYGKLLPKTPVKLTGVGASGEIDLWTGFIVSIDPEPQRYGGRYVTMTGHDRMREYQDMQDVILPVQTDTTADALLKLIDAAVYQGVAATGSITASDLGIDGDTVTISDTVYTLKDSLTPTDGQVGNFTDRYNNQATPANHYYIDDTIENLAAAINHADDNSNTYYADATPRNTVLAASVNHPAFGWPLSQRDTYMYLANSGSGSYTRLACQCMLAKDSVDNIDTIQLQLAKVGAPTGTLTITIVEQGGDGFPTTVLVDANATTTRAESSLPLSTSADTMVTITFPDTFTIPPNAMIVVETDTSPNATNYVRWGAEGTGSSLRGRAATYAGSWSASSANLIFWSIGTITLTANARGVWGNSVSLASSGDIAVSGASMTGGAQPTTVTPSYESGVQTFEYAGDTWGEGVNGMTAIQEVVESELGLYAIDRSGEPVYKSTYYWFLAHNQTRVTVDNTQATLRARYSMDDIRNQYTIEYRQRTIVENVTIGKGPKVLRLLPGSAVAYGGGRWVAHQDKAAEGWSRTVVISTVDGDTGEPAGLYAVVPPVLGTHYTLNTKLRTELGESLINPNLVRTSWAIKGAGVELTLTNVSGRLLWVHGLYLDGDIIDWSQPMQFYTEDSSSISTYGLAPGNYTLWLPTEELFARALGEHLISLWKAPRTIIENITVDVIDGAAVSHLFDVGLFDVLDVSEYQWSIDTPAMVMGLEYAFDAQDVTRITFHLRQLDPYRYLILDDAEYGKLDSYSVAL